MKEYDHLGPRTHFTPTELAQQEANAHKHPEANNDATSANESSASEHFASFRAGARTAVHHPWGFGIGNAGVTAERTNVKVEAGESTYTELAVETGLLGGLVFVAWSLALLGAAATRAVARGRVRGDALRRAADRRDRDPLDRGRRLGARRRRSCHDEQRLLRTFR